MSRCARGAKHLAAAGPTDEISLSPRITAVPTSTNMPQKAGGEYGRHAGIVCALPPLHLLK
jgi:hypothetical protein